MNELKILQAEKQKKVEKMNLTEVLKEFINDFKLL
jgi:hypothetical protein